MGALARDRLRLGGRLGRVRRRVLAGRGRRGTHDRAREPGPAAPLVWSRLLVAKVPPLVSTVPRNLGGPIQILRFEISSLGFQPERTAR